jgi:hypothetical protein
MTSFTPHFADQGNNRHIPSIHQDIKMAEIPLKSRFLKEIGKNEKY